jgi:hypothetical protein
MAGDHPDQQGATAAYGRAVFAAREQNAKLLELRAAARLAVHQMKVGDPAGALRDVAALCDWFGASPDLADVVRARKLLASEPLP